MLLLTPELTPAFVSPGWPMFPVDDGAPRNLDSEGRLCVCPLPLVCTHMLMDPHCSHAHTHVLSFTHTCSHCTQVILVHMHTRALSRAHRHTRAGYVRGLCAGPT